MTRAGSLARQDRVVVAAFLLLRLAVGLPPAASSAGDLRLPTGAVGTSGTLSVTRCVSEGSYRASAARDREPCRHAGPARGQPEAAVRALPVVTG